MFLGCDVFVLSKMAFLEGVFGFGTKINVSILHFFVAKFLNTPLKSYFDKNKDITLSKQKNFMVMFWFDQKMYFNGCFWLVLLLFVTTLLAKKTCFC